MKTARWPGRRSTSTARQLYSDTAKMIVPPHSTEPPLFNPAGTPLEVWLAQREARSRLE